MDSDGGAQQQQHNHGHDQHHQQLGQLAARVRELELERRDAALRAEQQVMAWKLEQLQTARAMEAMERRMERRLEAEKAAALEKQIGELQKRAEQAELKAAMREQIVQLQTATELRFRMMEQQLVLGLRNGPMQPPSLAAKLPPDWPKVAAREVAVTQRSDEAAPILAPEAEPAVSAVSHEVQSMASGPPDTAGLAPEPTPTTNPKSTPTPTPKPAPAPTPTPKPAPQKQSKHQSVARMHVPLPVNCNTHFFIRFGQIQLMHHCASMAELTQSCSPPQPLPEYGGRPSKRCVSGADVALC